MFQQSALKDCTFKNSTGLVFEDCTFSNVKFINMPAGGWSMKNCKVLSSTQFEECDFTNFNFEGTDVSKSVFLNCTENGQPISESWLREHGAVNTHLAAFTSSPEDASCLLQSSFFSVPVRTHDTPGPWMPFFVFQQ